MVTREGNSDISKIIEILTAMSDMYGSNQTDWNKFQLFNSTKYGDGSNLLFKDSTTELKEIPSDNQTYTGYLGEDYGPNRDAMGSCTEVTSAATIPSTSPIIELVLLIALLGAAHRFL